MTSWQTFFDLSAKIAGTTPFVATEVCSNDLIPGANAFDAAKVKTDAAAAELTPEMAAIDVDMIRAGMFDQSI